MVVANTDRYRKTDNYDHSLSSLLFSKPSLILFRYKKVLRTTLSSPQSTRRCKSRDGTNAKAVGL